MSLLLKVQTYHRLIRWLMVRNNFDLDRKPPVNSSKFKTAREAVAMIPDNAVVMSNGMTGTLRPSVFYRAIRDYYIANKGPKNLTWIHPGGGGGRGKVPASIEELAIPGLLTTFITGHHETARAVLSAADQGQCELVVLPQGTLVQMADAQSRGQTTWTTHVGLGTFMDPRVGTGSQVVPGRGLQLVEPDGELLKYTMPKITVACVACSFADADGNIYMDGAPLYGEAATAPRAARANGGIALVTVAGIVPRDDSRIFLKASEVDAIVVNPGNEMTLTIPMLKAWREMSPGFRGDFSSAMAKVRALNDVLKLDPPRGAVEHVLARQTARLFATLAKPGCHTIVGYGLPQEVGRLVDNGGLAKDFKFLIETGVYGGVPAPGIFFGTAFAPEKLISSAEMFTFCEKNLDVTILGMLQADAQGNVNVSRKSPGVKNYIGPGGFLNLVASAKTIIFVGAFSARSRMSLMNGKLTLEELGIPKFVERVEEVTFSAKVALAAGQKVYYVTPLATFRLIEAGLELMAIAPGISVEKDIVPNCKARIVLPADGKVPEYDNSVMTGDNFKLAWS